MNIKELIPLLLVVFIDLLGFGIVIPILPYIAESYGSGGFGVGMIMMIYSLMQFICAPFWGGLSDRFGRKKILIISISGIALSYLFLSQANSFNMIFIGRLIAGIFAANLSVAYAYVADSTTEENRAPAMGLLGAAFGMGFIFGPALGGILAGSNHNYSFVFLFSAMLSFLNILLALFILKEPKNSYEERAKNRTKRWELKKLKQVFSNHSLLLPIVLFFLTTMAITQLEVTFALFLKSKFLYTAKEAGLLLAYSGMIMVFTQGYLIKKLNNRIPTQTLLGSASFSCILGLIFFAYSPSLLWVLLSLSFLGFGHGILHPTLSAQASLAAPKDIRGFSMGWFHSASSLARILGPILAGFLFDVFFIELPFLIAAVFLIPIVLFPWIKKLK